MSYFSFNVDRKKCCGICKYWEGPRGEYNARNNIVKVDSNATGGCTMNHNQLRKGNNFCTSMLQNK